MRFASRFILSLAIVAAMLGLSAGLAAPGFADDTDPPPVTALAAGSNKGPIGWETYRRLDLLPSLAEGSRTKQFSSFGRDGRNNSDGFTGTFSCLRTDSSGCVIAEDFGPGEIQSIWFTRPNDAGAGIVTPTGNLRIVIDDTTVVDRNLQDVVDGKLGAPFVFPLVTNREQTSGGVTIKVPMPYRQSVKISTQTNPTFHHVTYREFADADGVTAFNPNDPASDVVSLLRRSGTADPKPSAAGATTTSATVSPAAGGSAVLASLSGPASISALRLRVPDSFAASWTNLRGLRLRMTFDGRRTVDSPVGEFFGAGLGEYGVKSLMQGMSTAAGGWYTSWWPMPYASSARIEIVNTTGQAVSGLTAEITHAPDQRWSTELATGGNSGHFTALSRRAATEQTKDWIAAQTSGRGRFVGLSQTSASVDEGRTGCCNSIRGYLEGDERVHVDGSLSPQLYGTGGEDYYESGWYYLTGKYSGVFTGNTGYFDTYNEAIRDPNCDFACHSMYRLQIGDAMSYSDGFRFGIEHGPQNDLPTDNSTTAFLYTKPETGIRQSDRIDVGSTDSRTAHNYAESSAGSQSALTAVFEGDEEDAAVVDQVRRASGTISFNVAVAPAHEGVLLRRISDQGAGAQSATVTIDGVAAGTWRPGLINTFQRWLEDDFWVPPALTAGKTSIRVQLSVTGQTPWSAADYRILNQVPATLDTVAPAGVGQVTVQPGRRHAIALSWAAVNDNAGAPAYRIYASTDPSVPVGSTTLVGATNAPVFRHGPLRAKTTWYYRVVAVDRSGNAGPSSAVVSATTTVDTSSDFNADGRDDIATFKQGSTNDLLTALSTGTAFGPAILGQDSFSTTGQVPLIGDVNGDGKADAVTFTRGDAADVFVALGTGDGTFGASSKWNDFFALGAEIPRLGDVDGDGDDDIITFTRGSDHRVFVGLSDGQSFGGGQLWHTIFAVGTEQPRMGDVNGDGRDDIITFTGGAPGRVYVALSNGVAFVENEFQWHRSFAWNSELAGLADVNGDGRDDAITFVRGANPRVFVALSDGGEFGASSVWNGFFAKDDETPGLGDFDGDGRADIITFTGGNPDPADVYVARSNGTAFVDGRIWQDTFGFTGEVVRPSLR